MSVPNASFTDTPFSIFMDYVLSGSHDAAQFSENFMNCCKAKTEVFQNIFPYQNVLSPSDVEINRLALDFIQKEHHSGRGEWYKSLIQCWKVQKAPRAIIETIVKKALEDPTSNESFPSYGSKIAKEALEQQDLELAIRIFEAINRTGKSFYDRECLALDIGEYASKHADFTLAKEMLTKIESQNAKDVLAQMIAMYAMQHDLSDLAKEMLKEIKNDFTKCFLQRDLEMLESNPDPLLIQKYIEHMMDDPHRTLFENTAKIRMERQESRKRTSQTNSQS